MIKFIKKTIITIFSFALGLIAFVVITHLLVRVLGDYSIKEDVKYIFVGHSHPECAFNDELINNSKNIAKSGESYFYTYHKVKEVLNENHLDVIFIEYTNNVINKDMDEWIWGYKKMNKYVPWHSPFMEKEELLLLYENNPTDFPTVITTSTRNNFTRLISLDLKIGKRYGAYNNLDRNEIDELLLSSIPESVKVHNDSGNLISSVNIRYLRKIVTLAKEHGCTVFFVRSPQHENFDRINEFELLGIKDAQFPDIEFLDFDNFPLLNEDYADYGHLNYKGAEKFSRWFNQLLKNDLLSKANKNKQIQLEISKISSIGN